MVAMSKHPRARVDLVPSRQTLLGDRNVDGEAFGFCGKECANHQGYCDGCPASPPNHMSTGAHSWLAAARYTGCRLGGGVGTSCLPDRLGSQAQAQSREEVLVGHHRVTSFFGEKQAACIWATRTPYYKPAVLAECKLKVSLLRAEICLEHCPVCFYLHRAPCPAERSIVQPASYTDVPFDLEEGSVYKGATGLKLLPSRHAQDGGDIVQGQN